MRRIFITGVLLAIFSNGFSQTNSNYEFIDYDKVIKEIYTAKSFADLKTKYDYISILSLDSSEIKKIYAINADNVLFFRSECSHRFNKYNSWIVPTDIKSVKECFADKNLLNLILSASLDEDLEDVWGDRRIYVKDDKSAIYQFLVKGDVNDDMIRITITEKGLLVELVYLDH